MAIQEIKIDSYINSIPDIPKTINVIKLFVKEYRYLSNFYEQEIEICNTKYPTNEHAYMAIRVLLDTGNRELHDKILNCPSGKDAKKLYKELLASKAISQTPDDVRIKIMKSCINKKFTLENSIGKSLIATGSSLLIEGNWWHDTLWGVYNNEGSNYLGKLLMIRRHQLSGVKMDSWMENYIGVF